jgi:hypothetical protein
MRAVLPFVLLLAFPAAAAPVDESRSVPAFDGVQVGSGIKARVEAGSHSVVLRGDPEALRVVLTEVRDGKLVVQIDPDAKDRDRPRGEIRVAVKLPRAKALAASGGSTMIATVPLTRDPALAASGGSTLAHAEIDADSLTVALSGGSRMSLAGSGGDLTVALSGASELEAARLAGTALTVQASGGSTAAVRATGAISGALSGGSRVRVPPGGEVTVMASGGSRIDQDL